MRSSANILAVKLLHSFTVSKGARSLKSADRPFRHLRVIAGNTDVRCFIENHQPIRLDGNHPYIHCRRRCIYNIFPKVFPCVHRNLSDQAPPRYAGKKSRPLTKSEMASIRLEMEEFKSQHEFDSPPPKVLQRYSLDNTEQSPASIDSLTDFEYRKKYYYDENVSAKRELGKAWTEISSLQKSVGVKQDAKLVEILKKGDGTKSVETRLHSPVFYPWTLPWKPDIQETPPKYEPEIYLEFESGGLERLL